MSTAAEETFALLGPRPEVAPGWLESHGAMLAVAVVATLTLASLVVLLLRRRRAPRPDPALAFRRAVAAARAAAPERRAPLAADALRAYLAALTADAPAALTTEELAGALVRSPLLATAGDPILRALRAADRAKFAGGNEPGDEALDLAELAFAHLELARRALWKEVAA